MFVTSFYVSLVTITCLLSPILLSSSSSLLSSFSHLDTSPLYSHILLSRRTSSSFLSTPYQLIQAIACRQDLEPIVESRYPFGALDGKVTSARLLMTAKAYDQKARVRALNTVLDGSSPFISTSSSVRTLQYSEADASSDQGGIRGLDEGPSNDDESWNKYFTSENRTESKVTFKNRKTEEIKKHQRAASRPPHAMARMGPSNSADGMPAFCWKEFSRNRDKRGKVFSHQGQPDCFDFPWVAMPPALFV